MHGVDGGEDDDGLCRFAPGGRSMEPVESWLTFCSAPDVLVLNYGLWHSDSAKHTANIAQLRAVRYRCGVALDSDDGRHYSYDSPALNTMVHLQQ